MKIQNTIFSESQKDLELFKFWPFPLSNFQKWALYALLNKKHVLITAHTGSGKTVPAEGAIEYFTKKGKRVIYTSPIKALTNQKFHEFTRKFPNISFGVITGDNKDNPDAQVLLMTAEILRNTIFRKKMLESDKDSVATTDSLLSFEMDIHNDLGCVIMDEAHYINDSDRGRIWEETIMLLPTHIQLLLLSATLNKPEETLVPLIEKRGGPEVHICSTDKRVVPLSHYAYLTIPKSYLNKMSSGDRTKYEDMFNKLLLLKGPENKETFHEMRYDKIRKVQNFLQTNRIRINKYFVLNEIVQMLREKGLLPAIMFVFSRRQVNILASKIQASLHEADTKMSSTVEKECEKLLRSKLPNWKEYTALPEYTTIITLLQKGIAIHHAGILKEFREMIELLFDKGYIKLLIATETFAVGINMPAKATIFASLEKFDGKGFRYLNPAEYTQMAGRAGRRGIDDKGVAIHLNNLFIRNKIPTKDYRHILTGSPRSISSKFSIHPNLILQLISSGNTEFTTFISGSMISKDINNSLTETKSELDMLEQKLLGQFKYRTSIGTLQRLVELQNKIPMLKSKKRKILQREYDQICDQTKFVKTELKQFCDRLELTDRKTKLLSNIDNIQTWITRTCETQVNILKSEEFIDAASVLTKRGEYALYLQEIPSLPVAELLDNQWLQNLTTEEITGVLSCFTNMRLSDEQSVLSIESIDTTDNVKRAIEQLATTRNKYIDIFNENRIKDVDHVDLHYNLCELVIKWCKCEDEISCKKLINECKGYDIGLGDYVKAILKINNIGKELENVATVANDLDLLSKLKKIPSLTLKFCITNQSLYL